MEIKLNSITIPENARDRAETCARGYQPNAKIIWEAQFVPRFVLSMTAGFSGKMSAEFTPIGSPTSPMIDATPMVMEGMNAEIGRIIAEANP